MMLGQLKRYLGRKAKFYPCLLPYIKIKSRLITNLNIKKKKENYKIFLKEDLKNIILMIRKA